MTTKWCVFEALKNVQFRTLLLQYFCQFATKSVYSFCKRLTWSIKRYYHICAFEIAALVKRQMRQCVKIHCKKLQTFGGQLLPHTIQRVYRFENCYCSCLKPYEYIKHMREGQVSNIKTHWTRPAPKKLRFFTSFLEVRRLVQRQLYTSRSLLKLSTKFYYITKKPRAKGRGPQCRIDITASCVRRCSFSLAK